MAREVIISKPSTRTMSVTNPLRLNTGILFKPFSTAAEMVFVPATET
jgi:hypothetical protein